METISEEMKAAHARAERSGNPSTDTLKNVNFLRLLGDRFPKGHSVTGDTIRNLVVLCERRGVHIPAMPIGVKEIRSLQASFDAATTDLPVFSGTSSATAKVYGATVKTWTNEQLRQRQQMQQFEVDCALAGTTAEAIERKVEEQHDPLMQVVNARQGKKRK
jgi:hypothetical protein